MITLTATSLLKARVHTFYSGIGTSSEFHAYQLYTLTHTCTEFVYSVLYSKFEYSLYIFRMSCVEYFLNFITEIVELRTLLLQAAVRECTACTYIILKCLVFRLSVKFHGDFINFLVFLCSTYLGNVLCHCSIIVSNRRVTVRLHFASEV